MNARHGRFHGFLSASGVEPYPASCPSARPIRPRAVHGRRPGPRVFAVVLALVLAALVLGPAVFALPEVISADGHWHAFDLKQPGQVLSYRFEIVSGCRYRVRVEGKSLPRVEIEVGPGEGTLYHASSVETPGPAGTDPAPSDETPPAQAAKPEGPPAATVAWYAERDDVYDLRVRGFSTLTGTGRVTLETLGPDGEKVARHRRFLAPGGTLSRVGDLRVDEANAWELVVREGHRYEIRSRPGTAGPLRLRVVAADGGVVASAEPGPASPYPALRFAPPPPSKDEEKPGPAPAALRLEVEAVDGAGGTYGVRLVEDPSPTLAPAAPTPEALGPEAPGPRAPGPDAPPPGASQPGGPRVGPGAGSRGLLLPFDAGPGDLAVLYMGRSDPYDPHWLQAKEGARWRTLPQDDLGVYGRRASMRTPENASLVWFRPNVKGTFRFVEPAGADAHLTVYGAEASRGGPLLIGTGLDPTVLASGTSAWRTVGVGVCMPGWAYLFVAVPRRRTAVAMRVETVDGDALAYRPIRGTALAEVAGVGPSLRFRVKRPTLVRLQVRGPSWEGYALLRRASN